MKKMLRANAIAAIVILASLTSAAADQVLMTCEQSEGWSYYLEGGMTRASLGDGVEDVLGLEIPPTLLARADEVIE